MSAFSETLSNLIKRNNISIYGLAKNIHCDRTGIQKVMSGERRMDWNTYNAVSRELEDKLSQPELEDLYEKFVQDYYGEQGYQKIMYIKKRLLETRKLELYIDKVADLGFDVTDYIEEFDIGKKEEASVRQIFQILEEEFQYAEKQGVSARLYTNIPSGWKQFWHLILILLNQKQIKGQIDLKCIFGSVNLEKQIDYGNSGNRFDMDLVMIENFITASEFAAYGYNTYEPGDQILKKNSEEVLFPYYIITNNVYVMVAYDGTIIIDNNSRERVNSIADKCRGMFDGKSEFLKVVNPDTYSSIILDRDFNQDGNVFDVVNRICVAAFYSKDILRKIVPENYPDRSFVIETVGMFYSSLIKQNISMYFTIESVKHFMESEDSKKEGQYFNLQFTPEIKLEILNRLYEYFSKSENSRIRMLKDNIMSNELHIFGWDSKIICACQYLYYGNTPVDAMSFVYSPSVTGHFEKYNEYILNSYMCLNQEKSLKVLRNLINSYEDSVE